jgi:hypothetical protein
MAKKDRKLENSDEMEIESGATVPAETPGESNLHDSRPEEEAVDSLPKEQPPAPLDDESSAEDLLDDVRRSLIEEETDQDKKESRWWRRIGKRSKRVEPETPSASVEIDLPESLTQPGVMEDQKQDTGAEQYAEEIDDLIEMLETQAPQSTPLAPEVELPPEPEPEIDFEKLKEQAFRPRTPDEESETVSDVRSVALEGGEEVFVEVQSQESDAFEERLSAFSNALRPYRSYIYIAFAFLGVVMAVIASFLIYDAYRQSRPAPVAEVSNLPFPTFVSLPGGWSFQLGRGTLQNGKWEPRGAEWLEGTEVSRWVALPWSLQLEAVLRTLNPKDPIELVMSNNDKLVYEVYSVYEMTPEEIQKLDANAPSLVLILTEANSVKRWVLTAVP